VEQQFLTCMTANDRSHRSSQIIIDTSTESLKALIAINRTTTKPMSRSALAIRFTTPPRIVTLLLLFWKRLLPRDDGRRLLALSIYQNRPKTIAVLTRENVEVAELIFAFKRLGCRQRRRGKSTY
jgi:hypothetical protein